MLLSIGARTDYRACVQPRYHGRRMDTAMKFKFRLYRRGRTYYVQDNDTGAQESLQTKDKTQATRLLNAKNEASILAGSNLQVARAYMVASDPDMPKRTWKEVIEFI